MVGHENGKVVMQFASPTAWIGFTPEQAMDIAQTLITHARKADRWSGWERYAMNCNCDHHETCAVCAFITRSKAGDPARTTD